LLSLLNEQVLKPLEKLDLREGEVVDIEIEIKRVAVDRLGGLVKIPRRDWADEVVESPELEPV